MRNTGISDCYLLQKMGMVIGGTIVAIYGQLQWFVWLPWENNVICMVSME